MKKGQQKKQKEKKKRLSFKKTVSNNIFALKTLWAASPMFLVIQLGSSIVFGILSFLSGSYLLRRIVNDVTNGIPISSVLRFAVILGIISLAAQILMQWFWNVTSPRIDRKIAVHIEKMLFKKAAEVELACYESPDFYDKYAKAMAEAYNRTLRVFWTLRNLMQIFTTISANTILLFLIDPVLIIFGLLPFLFGFIRRFENADNHKYYSEKSVINRRQDYVERTFYLGEYAKEMRIGGMYENMLRKFRETINDFRRLTRKYGRRLALYGYIRRMGLDVITILGAILYSVWSAMVVGPSNGGMNVGDCIVVINSIGTLSYSLNNLIQTFAQFGEHALFLEDVRYFLSYQPAIVGGTDIIPNGGGDISVKNLFFKYKGAEHNTLKNITFTLHKGERIALVGSNGAGKTTLVKLLLRLYDPTEGEITLENRSIKDFSLSSYRGSFSTVFQDFKMFSMSVKDNVLLRPEQEGDSALVESALKESGAFPRTERMKNGIHTVLTREFDDTGENLSVGEQQKISLARIFTDDTPFVILDEPSSALDPIAEHKMFENMMRATEGRSVIFISHRLSSAVLADRVLLMEDGTISECGTHEDLMAQNGKYAEMFRRQAENYLGSEVSTNE